MAEAGVGAEQEEEIREAGDGGSEIGARARAPHLLEADAAAPAQQLRRRDVGDVEAGAEDDRVDLALGPVGAHHR